MKSLKQIREAKSGGKEAYQKFFNSLLKKFGVSSPAELKGDDKKKFYDELDAGWESDDPNDKNERYEDPDNLDPETDVDSDEDMADKAASKVTEAKKLKPGRGKAEIDINFDGDRKDIKFATTKYMIKMKPHSNGAVISGDKAKLLAYLQGQDYAMDPEDIEDLYPELMESNYPKPLSIIRQNKLSDDALEEAYDMNEKMVMCEHCGKMHEEGACGDMKEANRFSKKLNKPSKKIFDLALAAIRRNNITDKKEKDEYVDDVAGVSLTPKEVELVKKAIKLESVEEMFSTRSIGLKGASKRSRERGRKAKEMPPMKGAKLGKAYPVLDAGTQRKVKAIAKKHSGDMERALKDIEKLKKGLGDNPDVMDILRKANETYDYGSDKAVKAAKKKTPGQKNEGVDVDRRTKGFKEAMKRAEAAKKKREAYKKKKEAKKDQDELDARYDYDGEVDTVLAAANSVMLGKKLPEDAAANSVASGNVDMTPHVKKKKKKELMARRNY